MTDLFQELRERVKDGGEESSGFSRREALLVLDAAYQMAKERDDWKRAHGELEGRATAMATARDDMEGRAVRAERAAAAMEAQLGELQATLAQLQPARER